MCSHRLRDEDTAFALCVFTAFVTKPAHLLAPRYHNVVPVRRGVRETLVIELWQGGSGVAGRR